MEFKTIKEFKYSEDLEGFVITLMDDNEIYTQFNIETNVLHADCGEYFLERYSEYDMRETTPEEDEEIDSFMKDNLEVKKMEEILKLKNSIDKTSNKENTRA